MSTRFILDTSRTAGEISPFWFGHNLEHTRSCIWRGLSAELLRNRKFAGLPQHDGVAQDWYRVGPRESWHLLEIAGGWAGTTAETYTQRWFDEGVKPCGQRQRAESYVRGTCGIGQRGIPLVGGRAYQGRLALRADRPLQVRVTVSGAAPSTKRFRVGPDGWTEATWKFKVARTNLDAKMELTFSGPGALFVGAASLLPANHFHGMRPDVIDLLKEISVPMLRWPGGNFAGYYPWRDGLLPVDQRTPIEGSLDTLAHTRGFDMHEVGTDEFIALCRALGAEPFLTINMSLEGPAEAAAWVEYCNGPADSTWGRRRAERGHPEPYGVRYWTLGNEMGYNHMKGPNTPDGYCKAAADCARAMKTVDPSLILVGSTGWAKKWYEEVLALDEVFDHISLHTYHPLIRDYTGDTGRQELKRLTDLATQNFLGTGLVNGEQQTRLTMSDMRAIINARPRGRKDIGIAFDEWNVWYAWYREPGVVEAIHAAILLNVFTREARNLGISLGAYFEPVNEGAILVEPGSSRLTPAGEVMRLFRAHHGATLLKTKPAADADLDLAASIRPDGQEVTITLVNRHPDETREAEIVLAGADLAEAAGVLLSATDFLPGTPMKASRLTIRAAGGTLRVAMPKHSVAQVRVPLLP